MGEYIWTHFEVGGHINSDDIEKLAAEIDEDEIRAAIAEGRPAEFAGETNYGRAEDLVVICNELKLSWRRTADPKYEFDGDITICFEGGDEEEITCNSDGDPYFVLERLETWRKEGKSIDDVIARMKHFTGDWPKLELADPELPGVEAESITEA